MSHACLCHSTGEEDGENQCELKASLVYRVRLASKEQNTNKKEDVLLITTELVNLTTVLLNK